MEIKITNRNWEHIQGIMHAIRREIDTVGVISTSAVCAWAEDYSHPRASRNYGWTREDNVKIRLDIDCFDAPIIRIDPEPKLLQRMGDTNVSILEQFKPHCSGIGDKTGGMCSTMFTFNLPHINEFVKHHSDICQELRDIYTRECSHIITSFHTMYAEEGFSMTRVWFADKFAEFKMRTMNKEKGEDVSDESIRTILLDIANYAIMTVMEIDREGSHGD